MQLEVTEQELRALLPLLDAALRQMGLNGSGAAVNWAMKVEAALNSAAGVSPIRRSDDEKARG